MDYKYKYKYNLTGEFNNYLAKLISLKENFECVCEVLKINVPEHKEIIFSRKVRDYVEKKVTKKNYTYFIIMDKETFQGFSKLSFTSKPVIEGKLETLSIDFSEYDGVFDAEYLIEKIPYLKEYFDYLDYWRKETKRVTLDSDVLDEAFNFSLNSKPRIRK